MTTTESGTGLSDGDVVLATKLRVPPLRSGTVTRPRLLQRLTEATARDLTLVCAPAGSGKTTVLADWAATRQPRVAWLSLDEWDNDVVRFWRYVAAAVGTVCGGVGEQMAALLTGPQAPHTDVVVATLVNALNAATGTVVLVLDDYHTIDAAPIHRGVTRLLERLPPQLRVVIASRADPPLPLGRLRARGQLVEVRADDLAFRTEEAGALLHDVAGVALGEPAIAALTDRTEGWVAGLQLAGLSLRDRDDLDGFVAAFSGTHRHVLDYLTEEVLARQPDDVVRFLLETSVLDRLCGPLADAVTGRDDTQQLLERLERANLFLVPLDDVRQWWRYHRLFAGLLQARLAHHQPHRVAELHHVAARWWDRNGPTRCGPWSSAERAIRHALAAGDHEWAAALVERHFDAAFHRAEEATLVRWLTALPDDVADPRPRLLAIRAFVALMGGRPDEAERLLGVAERRLDEVADEPFEPSVGRERSMVANLPAVIAVVHTQMARFRGDVDGTIASGTRAKAALTAEDRTLATIADWYLAVADWLQGSVADAERGLRNVVVAQRAAGEQYLTTWTHYDLGQVLLAQGRLSEALRTCQAVADHPGLGHVGIAEVHYARDELDIALHHATVGVDVCRQLAHDLPLGIALAVLARIRQARGDRAAAVDAIDEAASVVPGDDATSFTSLLNPVPTTRAWLWLAGGEPVEAARMASARGWDDVDIAGYPREREHLLMTRVLLAQGHDERAGALLERLHELALAQGRTGSVIEIQSLRALALESSGDRPAALAALADAVTLAQPEGHVRVFTDVGAPMVDLLATLTSGPSAPALDDPGTGHVGRVLRAFARASPSTPDRARGDVPGLVTPLTDREMDVLELLAVGRTNQQIAAELFVALVTVKKHVSHIFDKLRVSNRTEAVARARGLGLLP